MKGEIMSDELRFDETYLNFLGFQPEDVQQFPFTSAASEGGNVLLYGDRLFVFDGYGHDNAEFSVKDVGLLIHALWDAQKTYTRLRVATSETPSARTRRAMSRSSIEDEAAMRCWVCYKPADVIGEAFNGRELDRHYLCYQCLEYMRENVHVEEIDRATTERDERPRT